MKNKLYLNAYSIICFVLFFGIIKYQYHYQGSGIGIIKFQMLYSPMYCPEQTSTYCN